MNVLELSKKTVPCQRNWLDDYNIPQKDIDYIIKTCSTMPTKQEKNTYSLCAITDRRYIEKLYRFCYDPDDEISFNKNTQVLANLLLVWYDGPDAKHDDGSNNNVNVGVSAGGAALAAVELGYKTGFCKCFVSEKISTVLKPHIGLTRKKELIRIRLLLGIGVPEANLESNVRRMEGGYLGSTTKFGYTKNIKVTKI